MLLLIKRKTVSNGIKIVLSIAAIIAASFIGLSVYFGIAFGRNHSAGITGASDGPTAIDRTESNMRWTLDNGKIISGEITGKLVKNNYGRAYTYVYNKVYWIIFRKWRIMDKDGKLKTARRTALAAPRIVSARISRNIPQVFIQQHRVRFAIHDRNKNIPHKIFSIN
jgi:hypothetical protein